MQGIANVANILATVGGVVFILLLVWLARRPHAGADGDEARAYFDRHGHWPDEEPPHGHLGRSST